MFDTLSTLATAQAVRSATFPIQLAAPSPVSEWILESPRERNALLDAVFYDVGALSSEEAKSVALRYAAEGAILEVGPRSVPSLRMWRNFEDFSDQQGHYPALVVAGVGSSALGSAAFARNVADAAGAPVLAVVSGYGLADLLTEALGGYFLFGSLNRVRHIFEWLDDLRRETEPTLPPATGAESFDVDPVSIVRHSEDVRTLVALLSGGSRFDWLIGHSKGNLVVSEALYQICETAPGRFAELTGESGIITVSAKIQMPHGFGRIIDVMGALDNFGELNSRTAIPTDVSVPFAWHHTNTELPFHLDVKETLRPIMG